MTPTGLPRWNVITSIGAVSETVARGGGGAHGSVDLPPLSPGPRDGLAGTVPAVVAERRVLQNPLGSPGRTRQNDRFWRPALPRPCVPGQQRPSHPPVRRRASSGPRTGAAPLRTSGSRGHRRFSG